MSSRTSAGASCPRGARMLTRLSACSRFSSRVRSLSQARSASSASVGGGPAGASTSRPSPESSESRSSSSSSSSELETAAAPEPTAARTLRRSFRSFLSSWRRRRSSMSFLNWRPAFSSIASCVGVRFRGYSTGRSAPSRRRSTSTVSPDARSLSSATDLRLPDADRRSDRRSALCLTASTSMRTRGGVHASPRRPLRIGDGTGGAGSVDAARSSMRGHSSSLSDASAGDGSR
mmetsp:Transcript_15363/g.50091  ORF Transcript_15363/g.50091 Transcript_15363/m.50091 type:complete len:233 (-) Transcript_15363:128-826(-)